MAKAYSYLRFSTPEQAAGDSTRRQTEAAAQYANKHGLELDTELTFEDCGVSAFKGRNARDGRLRAFLRGVEDGIIPDGSFLLVESLDRISRDTILEAQGHFLAIIGAGITLVTLKDNRVYSRETITANPTDLIISLLVLMRAHEESAMKSSRVKAAYDNKRKRARDGDKTKPFTRRTPSWITWNDDAKEFSLIEHKAGVVWLIFQWADDGIGQQAIAERLNTVGEPPFERGMYWHKSYIHKILRNQAVIGAFVPKQREYQSDGSKKTTYDHPISNYFPAAVPQDLYERVKSRMAGVQARGRYAATEIKSIVAGVAKCGLCGSAMTRASKGQHVYLVCTKANAKVGCKYLAIPYGLVDNTIRTQIDWIIEQAPKGNYDEELESLIASLDIELDDLADKAAFLVDELRTSRSPAVRVKLAETEELHKAKKDALRAAEAKREAQTSRFVEVRLEALREAVKGGKSPTEINKALRACVTGIEIDPTDDHMKIEWATGSVTRGPGLSTRHYRSPFGEAEEGNETA